MPRTTIDLDPVLLRTLKQRARGRGTTLSRLVSELLAGAVRSTDLQPEPALEWHTAPMGARVDLRDKEAVRQALEDR